MYPVGTVLVARRSMAQSATLESGSCGPNGSQAVLGDVQCVREHGAGLHFRPINASCWKLLVAGAKGPPVHGDLLGRAHWLDPTACPICPAPARLRPVLH